MDEWVEEPPASAYEERQTSFWMLKSELGEQWPLWKKATEEEYAIVGEHRKPNGTYPIGWKVHRSQDGNHWIRYDPKAVKRFILFWSFCALIAFVVLISAGVIVV